MQEKICPGSWQVNAHDPSALTRLLDLPEFRVRRMGYDPVSNELLIYCDHLFEVAICPHCGRSSARAHQYRTRHVRDLSITEKRCYLVFEARRFKCNRCARPFTERLASIAPCGRYTRRYERLIFSRCQEASIQHVHQNEGLGYKAVEGIYYRYARVCVTSNVSGPVCVLGIDEIALKKGQGHYVLVLSDVAAGCVIAVLPERTKETLEAYLCTWTDAAREAVAQVAIDLWQPYLLAVEQHLPNANVTADRFHVMKQLNDQLTKARREIQRDESEAVKEKLKGARWLLVKNAEDLTDVQRKKLDAMFEVSPMLETVHQLKEDFRLIYETQPDLENAASALKDWMEKVEQTGLTALSAFLNTVRNWWAPILNYFNEHLTSGFVEGMNNKIKLIKRRAYGFRNFQHFQIRVLVECR